MDFSERERELEKRAGFNCLIDDMLSKMEIVEHEGKLMTPEQYREIMRPQWKLEREQERLEDRRQAREDQKERDFERAWDFLELTKQWGENNARDNNSKNRNY